MSILTKAKGKALTKEEQKEVIARTIANALIATDALRTLTGSKQPEALRCIMDNLAGVAYIIGGEKAEQEAKEAYNKYRKEAYNE